jgi:hypothetical protein
MYHVRIFCWAKIRESANISLFSVFHPLLHSTKTTPSFIVESAPVDSPPFKQYSDSRNTTPLDPSFRPSCSDFLVETIKLERPSNRPRPLRNEINVRRTLLFNLTAHSPRKNVSLLCVFFQGVRVTTM